MIEPSQADFWMVLRARLMGEPGVCVQVERHSGSVPRERGAWMMVFSSDVVGTVGGGHLEFSAIARARSMLSGAVETLASHRYPLGPSLGQCCGGVVWLQFELIDLSSSKSIATSSIDSQTKIELIIKNLLDGVVTLAPVALFGGGHVGKAIIGVLGGLPMRVSWIDSRDEIFPAQLPALVTCEHSAPIEAAAFDLALVPSGARVLVMSFSHAEDLEIIASCLLRQRERADLAFIGLIGSKTKWASFRSRLRARGFSDTELAGITCPIGVAGIEGKEPEVIAVAVAAQLLTAKRS